MPTSRSAIATYRGRGRGVFDVPGGGNPGSATLAAIAVLDMCIHISEWFPEGRPLAAADLEERVDGLGRERRREPRGLRQPPERVPDPVPAAPPPRSDPA